MALSVKLLLCRGFVKKKKNIERNLAGLELVGNLYTFVINRLRYVKWHHTPTSGTKKSDYMVSENAYNQYIIRWLTSLGYYRF